MAKLLKILFFAALLIAAGYFFGSVCAQVNQQYQLIFSLSKDLLSLVFGVLLALGTVAVAAGIVAVLFRPFWVCIVAFGLSTLAMLFGWEWRAGASILALLYFFVSLIYARGIAQELDNLVLRLVFPFLTALKVAKVVTETREARRLILG